MSTLLFSGWDRMNDRQPANDFQPRLFADQGDAGSTAASEHAQQAAIPPQQAAIPRLRRPQRDQGETFHESLDQRIEADHPVRIVWAFVEQLDLSPLLVRIKAVEGHQGRDANDPRLLMALWLYAAVEGVGSARQLERLCNDHRAFQWICGGVSINYHTLSDFRVDHVEVLDRLLAQSLASLTCEGLVDVNLVAQDGMRIRASAGGDSFRREATLKQHLQHATAHLEKLRDEIEINPAQLGARRKQARLRAAQDKKQRLEQAIDHVQQIADSREHRKPGDGPKARASSTDPEARRMKMPDGGTRPAYNAQFATHVNSGIIVGVQTSNAGNDAHELEPMLDDIHDNTGQHPRQMLVDGGYSTKANIDLADENKVELFTPIKDEQKQLDQGKDPYVPKPRDSEAMKEFRTRMAQTAAKATYKLRGQAAEWVNANARNRGLYMLRVRGKAKVQAVLLLFALAHNLLRAEKLRTERTK
jgi:transposase